MHILWIDLDFSFLCILFMYIHIWIIWQSYIKNKIFSSKYVIWYINVNLEKKIIIIIYHPHHFSFILLFNFFLILFPIFLKFKKKYIYFLYPFFNYFIIELFFFLHFNSCCSLYLYVKNHSEMNWISMLCNILFYSKKIYFFRLLSLEYSFHIYVYISICAYMYPCIHIFIWKYIYTYCTWWFEYG